VRSFEGKEISDVAHRRIIVKHINRLVTAYLRDSSDSLENTSKNLVPDLKAIATDASSKDLVTV